MQTHRKTWSRSPFLHAVRADDELLLPLVSNSPTHDLQRLLSDHIHGENGQLRISIPKRSKLADQIEAVIYRVSRYSGPILLVGAAAYIGALLF